MVDGFEGRRSVCDEIESEGKWRVVEAWWVVVTVGECIVDDCGPLVVTLIWGLAVVELVVVMVGPWVVVDEAVCIVLGGCRPY